MGKRAPHQLLILMADANSPTRALRRMDPLAEIPEDILAPHIVQGGSARQPMAVEIGRTPHDGKSPGPTFTALSINQSGTGRVIQIRPNRFPLSSANVRAMLRGTQKMPDGITREILCAALPILEKGEKNHHAKVRPNDRKTIRTVSRQAIRR